MLVNALIKFCVCFVHVALAFFMIVVVFVTMSHNDVVAVAIVVTGISLRFPFLP